MQNPAGSPREESQRESDALVSVQGVSKSFGRAAKRVSVLRDVNLEVAPGELLVLLGPSGCGKTTLLRSLVGLERPDAGRISLRGTCVVDAADGIFAPPNKRDVGMVFQNYALWPHMTVAKNVAYPLASRREGSAATSARVEEVLDIVQCGHLSDRYPPELSGGQQQRVSLARALAPSPALLLLDEPLSNLDALLRVELRAQLRLLHRELLFTAVHVTHDQEEAIALGTRVAVMNAGRIEQIGPPVQVYDAPATEYVADFLGARNRLDLTAAEGGTAIAGRPVAGLTNPPLRGDFAVRLRDEHLTVRPSTDASANSGQAATVEEDMCWIPGAQIVEMLPGVEMGECVLALDEQRLFARTPPTIAGVRPGDRVDVGFRIDKARCYEAEDSRLVTGWASGREVVPS